MAKRDKDECTALETVFCLHYVTTNNGLKAAKLVNPKYSDKVAGVMSAQWMKRPRVKKEIARLREKQEDAGLMGKDEAVKILDTIIRANLKDYYDENGATRPIKDITREQAIALEEITTFTSERDGGASTVMGTSVKMLSKLAALDKKLKTLGLYKSTLVVEDPYGKYLEQVKQSRDKQRK